jgi:hypothetical protein
MGPSAAWSSCTRTDRCSPWPALEEDRYGPTDPERVKGYVTDLVEAAKVKAHDEMGDGRRAVAVAIRWLRPVLGPSAVTET